MMVFILILVIAVLLPDVYIWSTFIRRFGTIWGLVYWIPTIVIVLSFLTGFVFGGPSEWIMKLFFYLFLAVSIPKLLFAVVSLVGKAVSLLAPVAFTVGNVAGLAVALLVFGSAVYGFAWGWKRVVVKNVDISSAEIPATFDGYKIVQLSDFHISTYDASPKTVDEIVDKVNALNPDAIMFTGDLVNMSPDEIAPYKDVLARLKAKDGVFSILGNHDYCAYRRYDTLDGQAKSLEAVIRQEREIGWQLLINENRILRRGNDSIAIVGVENAGSRPFVSRADLPKALNGLSDGTYKILLSHDPTHWRRNVLPETDIQLTLSGHTHAMQLKIGNFSPSQWTYDEWGGLYEDENGRKLYVSTGTGSNVAFRLGAWPEIDVITLHSGK